MNPDKFSTLYDDWKRTESGGFVAPLVSERPAQILIFPDQFKDATIVADVTPLEGKESPRKPSTGGKEASIVFRYSGFEGFYYAGIGGFGTKFFIAKAMPGPVFQPLGSVGQQSSIQYKTTYHLRVECHGNRLTLYDNDVQQIMAFDESYQSGQWGIQAFRTSAQFDHVKIHVSQPKCFVVMPFAAEFSFVYQVIKETVEAIGLDCIRADEVMISRPVVDDLKGMIAQADLVIVDFTGKNPNVYYEAGLADAWKKNWIVISQSSDDLTFDVRHIRTILYSNRMGADVLLRENLGKAIRETMGYTVSKP